MGGFFGSRTEDEEDLNKNEKLALLKDDQSLKSEGKKRLKM